MHMNRAGLDLVTAFEGWRAKAYRDVTGIWTIGYGHTSAAGSPTVKAGMTLTREEGMAILHADLKRFAEAVRPLIKVELNANQFSALLSFAFNVGPANFGRSSVLRYVNQKRFAEVPARLSLWNKAGGRVLRGLSRRRAAEGALFLAPPTATDGRNEADEMHQAGGRVTQRQGKSALQSSTNRAAAGLTLAVVIEQLGEMLSLAERTAGLAPDGLDWHVIAWPLALSLGAVVLGIYIIRERMKKSTEYGV
ncbi:MAG: lysozyme [Pseudomonadota bacterium]